MGPMACTGDPVVRGHGREVKAGCCWWQGVPEQGAGEDGAHVGSVVPGSWQHEQKLPTESDATASRAPWPPGLWVRPGEGSRAGPQQGPQPGYLDGQRSLLLPEEGQAPDQLLRKVKGKSVTLTGNLQRHVWCGTVLGCLCGPPCEVSVLA